MEHTVCPLIAAQTFPLLFLAFSTCPFHHRRHHRGCGLFSCQAFVAFRTGGMLFKGREFESRWNKLTPSFFFFLFWSLFTGVARSNFCASIYGWVGGSVWKISRIDRYGNRRFERIFSWNDRAIGIRSIKMFLIALGEGGLVLTFLIRGKSLRKFAALDGLIWT